MYSFYLTYRFTIEKYNFRIVSRLEQTNVQGHFIKSNTEVNQDYLTFMPSLFVSRKFTKIHTLSLSYIKRLTRPYIWDLNPFVNNTDSLNLYFGNVTLSVNANNIFQNEQIWRSYFKDANFQTQQWNYRPARSVNIGLRWNFGKLTENVSLKRGVSNDDLKAKD